MFSFIDLNRNKFSRDLLDIESILQSSLKPVSPRPEFIQNLHKGLMEYTFPQPETSEIDIKKTIAIALAGFTGMILFLSLWIRLLLVIISALGMLQTSKQRKETTSQ